MQLHSPITQSKRQRVFGLEFVSAPSEDAVASWIGDVVADRAAPRDGHLRLVVTPNVDQLVRRDRGESKIANDVLARADVVLPDGQPVVWASRWLGRALDARLTGSGLVARLWPQLTARGARVAVIASSERVAEALRKESEHALVLVAPVLRSAEDTAAYAASLVDQLAAHRPEAVFASLGYPKQEGIIDELTRHWPQSSPPPWFFAIGASFDMYLGIRRRAPQWMQRAGLEWFHRFLLEPRRMFRRYFIDDPTFLRIVWRERRALRAGVTTGT